MCNCLETINEKLAPNGQELPVAILLKAGRMDAAISIPIIRKDTGKPENRRKLPSCITARFCPFCGEEQGEEQAA